MSNKKRVPERYGWWQKKLASLDIVVKKGNELNDVKELRDLTESIKQTFIQDYKELLQQ